jgi:hypothetical protein
LHDSNLVWIVKQGLNLAEDVKNLIIANETFQNWIEKNNLKNKKNVKKNDTPLIDIL